MGRTKKFTNMFPPKLHYILSLNTNAIMWTPDGTAIRIADRDLLTKEILPVYFKQSAYASFIHQLNAYGFERIKKGTNKDCYFHPFFLRDAPELMFQLYRMPSHTRKETTPERLSMFSPMFNLPALVPSSHFSSSAPPSFQSSSSSSSREQDQSSPPLSQSQSQSESELPPKTKKQQIPLVQQIYM